ncbi:MAG TPA: pyridoxal 5'-phosphate synthase lyase subunit PdxS, partial [Methanothermococcus okinawensis]|nr:pyridoxal 5'-phosphate synthase lyase subunit PdxS [Methanothermococcus okinawensis]
SNPEERAKAIVEATHNYDKPEVISEVSKNLGEAMVGINIEDIPEKDLLAKRGD